MNYNDILDTFANVWSNMYGSDYSIGTNNCKAYAKAVWNYVNSNYAWLFNFYV
jgi:hypothetical protein